jgi:hypothetical protein
MLFWKILVTRVKRKMRHLSAYHVRLATIGAFVVSGLIKRRAELAAEIERAHEALRKMVLDLKNLGATILQFEPDFRVEGIRPEAFRPPKDWSNRGQLTRIVLSILRQAAGRLSAAILRWSYWLSGPIAPDDQARRCGVARAEAQVRGAVRTRPRAIHALGNYPPKALDKG